MSHEIKKIAAKVRRSMPILVFFACIFAMMLSLSVHDFSISSVHARTQGRDGRVPGERAERLTAFMITTNQLMQEIKSLKTHPGWPDMALIIKRAFSVLRTDKRAEKDRQMKAGFDTWSRKWQSGGQYFYSRYLILSKRSRALERQRESLVEEWQKLRQGLLRLVIWLVIQGEDKRESSTELLKLVVELDQEHGETVGRYTLDNIDLCRKR